MPIARYDQRIMHTFSTRSSNATNTNNNTKLPTGSFEFLFPNQVEIPAHRGNAGGKPNQQPAAAQPKKLQRREAAEAREPRQIALEQDGGQGHHKMVDKVHAQTVQRQGADGRGEAPSGLG